MHFVTGGAFNGKRKWVAETYHDATWISAYKGDLLKENLAFTDSSVVVMEGLEVWVKDASLTREEWQEVISQWAQWEQETARRRVVIIGADIGKGIVPMEKENRIWRDQTGWVYQDLVSRCEKADVIWYGINQSIKG